MVMLFAILHGAQTDRVKMPSISYYIIFSSPREGEEARCCNTPSKVTTWLLNSSLHETRRHFTVSHGNRTADGCHGNHMCRCCNLQALLRTCFN